MHEPSHCPPHSPLPPDPAAAESALLAALLRMAGLARPGMEMRDLFPAITSEFIEFYGATVVFLALADPLDGALVIEDEVGLPDGLLRRRIARNEGLVGRAAFHLRLLATEDAQHDVRALDFERFTRATLVAPLGDESPAFGAVSIGLEVERPWTPAEIIACRRLAAEAARVLRLGWEASLLRAKAAQLGVLIDVGQQLVAKFDQRELLDALTREALALLDSTHASIHLLTPDRTALRLVSVAGRGLGSQPLPGTAAAPPVAETLSGIVLQTRKQLEIGNILAAEYADCLDVPHDRQVRSMLATPLISEGEPIGTLNVFTREAHRFSNDERRLLLALASLGAVAIQNQQLYARAFASEQSLQRNEKLTTLGLLASEIAHEIRNPLTVLKLLFGSLGLEFPEGDPRRKDTEIIREKLDQLEAIVARVLGFGRAPTAMHQRLVVADLVRDTLLLVRFKLQQSKVSCDFFAAGESLAVEGNRGQLQQVLLNLVINALQALPGGGRITLRLTGEEAPRPALVLEVEDTGGGIPPELKARVFDSFLSGRPDGTGLGLAITKRILRAHHGDIDIARTGPEGTVMRLRLPLAPPLPD